MATGGGAHPLRLSYGAKVIGPRSGSFEDYAAEPALRVYTFDSFGDIPGIVARHRMDVADRIAYASFLRNHDWPYFANRLTQLLFQAV